MVDPPNSRLSGDADPPTSQRYFERCNVNDVIESDKCYIFFGRDLWQGR